MAPSWFLINWSIKLGLSSVKWPARIQKIHNEPNVYYDVAHNESSFTSLCNYVNNLKGERILILALQRNKILGQAIPMIEHAFDKVIITQSNIRNYIPASDLSRLFSNNKIDVIVNLTKAIQLYKQYSKETTIIIAGSHYLGPSISKEFKISFDNI